MSIDEQIDEIGRTVMTESKVAACILDNFGVALHIREELRRRYPGIIIDELLESKLTPGMWVFRCQPPRYNAN